jgi:hypothetical protein
MDVSAAMLAGTGLDSTAGRPRCAVTRVTDNPAAALASHRKLRLFNMM